MKKFDIDSFVKAHLVELARVLRVDAVAVDRDDCRRLAGAKVAAGTYTLTVDGEGVRTGLPPRQLVVSADAKETSCKLTIPGTQPASLDVAGYSKSCSTDSECQTVTVGDVCSPCKCPNEAIAKTSGEAYAGDYRAHASQCHTDKSGIQCAACAPSKATCTIMANALTGTCELKPGM